MKTANFFRMTAVAAALCLASGAANANTSSLSFTKSVTTPYVWTAVFYNPSVSGTFSDAFTFNNPVLPVSPSGGSSNALSLGIMGTSVIFDIFQLMDATTSTVLASGITGGTSSFMNFLLPNATDSYALVVSGHTDPLNSTGTYAGNIAISAVPEPETYAMLLAGLGLIGITALRRKPNTMAFA